MSTECSFRTGAKQCPLVPGESGRCPRHQFLVEQLGEEKALKVEWGEQCGTCGKFSPEGTVKTCEVCQSPQVCGTCRDAGTCCDYEVAELEGEIADLEDQLDNLRDRLPRARRAS